MRVALAVAVALGFVTIGTADPALAAVRKPMNIPAQELSSALQALAKDCDLQVVFASGEVEKIRTTGATGELTTAEALTTLLSGTGLTYTFLDDNTVTVAPVVPAGSNGEHVDSRDSDSSASSSVSPSARTSPGAADVLPGPRSIWSRLRLAQSDTSSASPEEGDEQAPSPRAEERFRSQRPIELEEITVTGSHIRGADVSSPVVTITQEEMRLSGHSNLGDVIRALPQNFGGGQNPGVVPGVGGSTQNQNNTGASGFNLRGLGQDATLTLLNGMRLPYDGASQATDVSVIPVAAIERMEVLLDGASAIYGSDAVGGVANIILKRDYVGAELSARYGVATDGGYEQQQYTGVAGTNWGSGGFLVAGDSSNNTAVRASDREYLSYLPRQGVTLYPGFDQKGVLFSGHQQTGDRSEASVDMFYTERGWSRESQSSSATFTMSRRSSTIWGVAPALRVGLPHEWSLRLHGVVGRNDIEMNLDDFNASTGLLRQQTGLDYLNKVEAAGVESEGPLFALPGGDARVSFGGGYRRNEHQTIADGAPVTQGPDSSRYGYGEINLPLVGEAQNVRLVRRLSLNGAFRHETYDSFGETTVPKVGAVWSPTRGLDVKASWGRSFKVPTLLQQHQDRQLNLYPATTAGGAAVGAPANATVLARFGGNPDLHPERAEVVTVSIVARPQFLPGFMAEISGFEVDYQARVVQPVGVLSQALSNPLYAQFITLNPSIEQQQAFFAAGGRPVGTFTFDGTSGAYDPANVYAIIHNQRINATAQHMRGLDLMFRHRAGLFGGSFAASGSATWIIDSTQKLTSLAQDLPTSGVIFYPVKFKGRLGFTWSQAGLSFASHVDHIGGVRDTNIVPNPQGRAMTTIDVAIDYQLKTGVIGDIGLNMAVANLFDERPPFMQPAQPFHVNYDSTNYNALGRVVSATITKQF